MVRRLEAGVAGTGAAGAGVLAAGAPQAEVSQFQARAPQVGAVEAPCSWIEWARTTPLLLSKALLVRACKPAFEQVDAETGVYPLDTFRLVDVVFGEDRVGVNVPRCTAEEGFFAGDPPSALEFVQMARTADTHRAGALGADTFRAGMFRTDTRRAQRDGVGGLARSVRAKGADGLSGAAHPSRQQNHQAANPGPGSLGRIGKAQPPGFPSAERARARRTTGLSGFGGYLSAPRQRFTSDGGF
jgi:hypothetical protein